ncbi:hypothetical protein FQN60_006498 [Etheostoma spectabile]|uniref:Uncharacterized protein n=1 Tax=Etheostoma spectabile TaxID=54343 RepID=A0A5J5CA79_9PERO|nr:hypothetical protein FQN60_006498 [Etheostoma spectabile]
MMSAAQSPTTLESKLKALQCHFTGIWTTGSPSFTSQGLPEDIGTEEGNSWLGHIYNLRGFVQYQLGFTEDAQSLFTRLQRLQEDKKRRPGSLVGGELRVTWRGFTTTGRPSRESGLPVKGPRLMKKYPSPSRTPGPAPARDLR